MSLKTKIKFDVEIDMLGSRASKEQIIAALGHLGQVRVGNITHIKSAPAKAHSLWLYWDPDEGEPCYLVKDAGSFEGKPLSSKDYDRLVESGVCSALFCRHPRTDRHGHNIFKLDAEAFVVSEAGFIIADALFSLSLVNTGDDTPERYWLKITTDEPFEPGKP